MSAKNFKVGDKVKVRRDLIIGKFYGNVRCNNSMERMVGKVFTIRNVDEQYYKVTENEWNWSDGMLEPVEKTLDNLCVGDFVGLENIKRKVLAVVDGCYLLSDIDNYASVGCWYTPHDLKNLDCMVVEPLSQEPTIEIKGKKYEQSDIEEAIKDLKPIE